MKIRSLSGKRKGRQTGPGLTGRFVLAVIVTVLMFFLDTAVQASEPLHSYREARRLIQAGQFDQALGLLQEIKLSHFTLQDYLLFDEALCLEKTGRTAEAAQNHRFIINTHKKSPVRRRSFLKLLELGRINWPETVGEDYRLYLQEFPDDLRVSLEFAQLLERGNGRTEAINLYRRVFFSGSKSAPVGLKYLQELGLPPGAAEIKQAASRLLERENPAEAVTLLEPLSIEDEELRLLLARGFFNLRRYREAIGILERTKNPEGRRILASSLARNREIGRFYQLMDELLKDGRGDLFSLHYSLGEFKRRDGHREEARRIFVNMLKLYPDRLEQILWGQAWLEIRERRFAEAEGHLHKLLSEKTQTRDKYLFWLGKIRAYQGITGDDFFSQLKDDNGYYWLTVNRRPRLNGLLPEPRASLPTPPPEPLQTVYARLADLAFLRMNTEAAGEAQGALNLITPDQADSFARLLFLIDDYQSMVRLGIRNNIPRYRYPPAYLSLINKHASRHRIDPLIVISVMREESHFQPTAVSRAGALGLMQLMPATARRYGKVERNEDLFQVEKNIAIGTEHLARLIGRFPSLPHALAAYNAGEGHVQRWMTGSYLDLDEFVEDIPFAETRNYVLKVLRSYQINKHLYGAAPEETIPREEMF